MDKRELLKTAAIGLVATAILGGTTYTVVKTSGWFRKTTPVLLVHGWGNDSTVWEDRDYSQAFEGDERFSFRGKFRMEGDEAIADLPEEENVDSDVPFPIFTLDLPNGASGDIRKNGECLGRMVQKAKEITGADRVVLVGFSLGGVICREYTTSEHYQDDVKRVITISSPHKGTEFAVLSDYLKILQLRQTELSEKSDLASRAQRSGLTATLTLLKKTSDTLDIQPDGEALTMLHPPRPGNYLHDLNNRPHPKDVEWFSIVAEKNITNYQLREFWEDLSHRMDEDPKSASLFAVMTDILRNAGNLTRGQYFAGDGVVSTESQSLDSVSGLKDCKVKTLREDSSHLQDFIQKELVKLLIGDMGEWEYIGDPNA